MKPTLIEAQHLETSTNFYMPPKEDRLSVREGDLVKIGFRSSPEEPRSGEHMWVIVRKKTQESFLGEINHILALDWGPDLKIGKSVNFESKHILDISLGFTARH